MGFALPALEHKNFPPKGHLQLVICKFPQAAHWALVRLCPVQPWIDWSFFWLCRHLINLLMQFYFSHLPVSLNYRRYPTALSFSPRVFMSHVKFPYPTPSGNMSMCCHAWWWPISFFFHSPAPRNSRGSLVKSGTSAAVLRPVFTDPKLPPPEDLCPFPTLSCSEDVGFGQSRRTSLHRLFSGSAGVFLGVLWQDEVSPSIPHQRLLPDLGNAASFLGIQCCSTIEDELIQLAAWKCPCPFSFYLTHFFI